MDLRKRSYSFHLWTICADLYLQGERWGVTRHGVTSIPSSAEKELEREINLHIGQMNDQLNVFWAAVPYVSHLRASASQKNSAKNSDSRIYVSHVFMYLLFARYLIGGLIVQIAIFPLGQEGQEWLLENFEWITQTSDTENFYHETSSLPRLRANNNIYDT